MRRFLVVGVKLLKTVKNAIHQFINRGHPLAIQIHHRGKFETVIVFKFEEIQSLPDQLHNPLSSGKLIRYCWLTQLSLSVLNEDADLFKPVERKMIDHFLQGENFLVAMRPAQPYQVVQQCLGQIAGGKIFHHTYRTMTL